MKKYLVSLLILWPAALNAQTVRDIAPLKYWSAPLYWQPSPAESSLSPKIATATSLSAAPNMLMFIAMTPCRVVDTRGNSGFSGAFGPPSLAGGVARNFPIPSSSTCSIPVTAQAYSFNVTVVPPGPLGYLTVWSGPLSNPQPVAATLNSLTGTVVANGAVIAAGTDGSVNVFASNNTDLVIDINGYYASPTDLNGNTAVGTGALENNTTGINNTASGYLALQSNTSGAANTANGASALLSNTIGAANTANGASALLNNTTGSSNTAFGVGALLSNTTGYQNTAIGYQALRFDTTGSQNTASGVTALQTNATGSNNIGIGYLAANNVHSSSNNIHIGSVGAPSDSGTIRIGGNTALGDLATQSSVFVSGIRGVTTFNNDAIPVVIDSNGQLGTVSSSRRFKEGIQDMRDASSGLMRLRPVTFHYQKPFADGTKPIQYGLIAEEVAEVYPDLIARSADGEIETVKYQVLDSMLLNEVQRQERMIEQQKHEIEALKAQLNGVSELRSRLVALENAITRNR